MSHEGSHQKWAAVINERRQVVSVVDHHREISGGLLQSIIRQSGLTREQFYCAVDATARKIGKKYQKPEINQ